MRCLRQRFIQRAYAARDGFARSIRDTVIEQVPAYARLSTAQRHGELFDVLHHAITRALILGPVDAANTDEDLAFFRTMGERRAHQRFSLTDLRHGAEIAAVAFHQIAWSLAEPGDLPAMLQLSGWSAREVPRTMEAVTVGYLTVRVEQGDDYTARSVLTARLLAGQDPVGIATAARVTLPASYLVLVCAVPRVTLAERPGAIGATLGQIPGGLHRWNHDRLVVLLPVDGPPKVATEVAAGLVASLSDRVGTAVRSALAQPSTLAGIPDAVTEASEVLTLAAGMPGSFDRPVGIDEFLVELAMMRQPELVERLANLLAPLNKGSNLRDTLESLYHHELDRDRTAKHLQIHRRTLHYRLGRIHDLTGIDPLTTRGIQLLRAALTCTTLHHRPST